jgi:hypothetical protein
VFAFDLLETNYKSAVVAQNLNNYLKKEVKLIAYLVSYKQVPTKVGMMFFWQLIDVNEAGARKTHNTDNFRPV